MATDLAGAARDLLERSRRDQNLPTMVTDPEILRRIAGVLGHDAKRSPVITPGTDSNTHVTTTGPAGGRRGTR